MAAFARKGAWLLVAVAAVAAASCDAVLGIREYPETTGAVGAEGGAGEGGDADGGARACGIATGSGACAACVETKCCAQAEACAGSSACAAYADCVVPCGGDYACRARCMIAEYGSAAEIPGMDQCVSAECGGECGLVCGMTGSYAEPDAAEGCVGCVRANGCAAAVGCGGSIECQAFIQCATTRTTLDSLAACPENNDAGVSLALTYGFVLQSCARPCGLGAFWDCAPSPGPTVTQLDHTTLTINLTVLPSGAAVSNATVKACDRADLDCTTPVVPSGTTDAQGNVTFVLPALGELGFQGYFDVSSPSTYPTLYFLQAPLSVPEVTLTVALGAPSLVAGFYTSYGTTSDPALGTIEIQAGDCHWFPAPNVTAHASFGDAGASLAYFLESTLTPSATSTDQGGYAVLLNAPVGTPVTVSVTPVSVGQVTSVATVFARPGKLSLESVRP